MTFILAREMKEESDRFFTFFWIFFGFMVLVAFLCSLKKMCDSAAKERQSRRIRSSCGNWIASQPAYAHSERMHRSAALSSSPYYPTVIDVNTHSYIPERILETSSAPKIRGSVLIDMPPAYDDIMGIHSSDHNCATVNHESSDVGCSFDKGGSSGDTGGCSGDTGGSSTNDWHFVEFKFAW